MRLTPQPSCHPSPGSRQAPSRLPNPTILSEMFMCLFPKFPFFASRSFLGPVSSEIEKCILVLNWAPNLRHAGGWG
jgi:hypothetical protein